ncbi:ABC transporter ATP-binding protein [Acidimicrobiaceae bacterium]|jgi:ABC-type branched-subunit amino acid transport system ATPase component|nr:ABC transporter ATP-binding protein [Acidimicrobiaceae bacterium]|tara:strand:+ start:196 stop:966 length:771 start_codon:yes stop_codon:yes gene_type:complete
MSNKYLEVTNLKKSFGGIKAVDVQSLNLNRNELTSIIGPNGAGKTTFFDLISGFQDSDEGKVYLNKKNITRSQPYSIARLGMIRTFQLTKVFDRMTVLENMMFSASSVNNDSFMKSLIRLPSQKTTEKNIKEKSFEIMKDLNIDHMANSYARELSGGQKKLLELGRSIVNDPSILLLDEPLAGVNPKLAEEILQIILNLSEKGISILMVEHNIEAVMKISQRVIVLAEGMVIADDIPENVRTDEKVIEAYLGSENE